MAGDPFFDKARKRWGTSGVGTNAGVTVTQAAPSRANAYLTCSGIQCSGDAAALVTIESPSGTALWRKRFAGAFSHSETFPIGQIISATAGQAMLVKISASTANCEANIQGFEI